MRTCWLTVALLVVFSQTSCTEPGILDKLDNYTIIYPKRYDDQTRISRSISTIHQEDPRAHTHSVSFHLKLNETTNFILDLNLNTDLLTPRYYKSILTKLGVVEIEAEKKKNFHHCNYHGNVRGVNGSHVRLSTCNGISGYVHLPHDFFYIRPLNKEDGSHVVYRTSDLRRETRSLKDEINFDGETSKISGQMLAANLEHTASARTYKKYFVELGVVVHKTVCDRFKTVDEIEEHVTSLINEVDGMYLPLNIRVILSHIELWKDENPILISVDSLQALEEFTNYAVRQRRKRSNAESAWVYADAHLLLHGVDFLKSVLGKAYKGEICKKETNGKPYGVSQDEALDLVSTSTFAHELGHILGLEHDEDIANCRCSFGDCIMTGTLNRNSPGTFWSSCSKIQIFDKMRRKVFDCLAKKPDKSRVFRSRCGNEIIEDGEECDCGFPENCKSKCCDPATCKLVKEAECDSDQACCTSQCKFQQRGIKCRSSINQCDLPEFCTGQSATCPNKDLHKQNGNTCERGLCQDGSCVSRDQQCASLYGPTAYGAPEKFNCFRELENRRMTACGKNAEGTEYRHCEKKDWTCGSIMCSGKHTEGHGGFIGSYMLLGPHCLLTLPTRDFAKALVNDGIECGDKKVCLANKCVENLAPKCNGKCNKRGVCNNEGNCHCDSGWAPPNCLYPGNGGSVMETKSLYPGNGGSIMETKNVAVPIVVGVLVPLILLAIGLGVWLFRFGGREKVMKLLSRFRQSDPDVCSGVKKRVLGTGIPRKTDISIPLSSPINERSRPSFRAPPTRPPPLPSQIANIPPLVPAVSRSAILRSGSNTAQQRKTQMPPKPKANVETSTRKVPAFKPLHIPPQPPAVTTKPVAISVNDLKKRFDVAT